MPVKQYSTSPEILRINISTAKTTQRQDNPGTYSTTLTVNKTRAIAQLVRERCKINCIVSNKPLKLLLKSCT